MNPIHNQTVKQKYDMLYDRVSKAIQTGRFSHYKAAKKQGLYNRLKRYERRLKHWGYAVASATALFLSPVSASGQPVPTGTEFLVNTYTTDDQGFPSIAMDSDGDFVIAWQSDGQYGDFYGIYAQRYNSSGLAQGAEFLVNTYTTDSHRYPSIAMDSDGDFVIAWTSVGQDGDGEGIYAQRYNSSGVAQGTEFLVNTYTTSDQLWPSIAMDSDGDFVIAWESIGQDGSYYGIYAQRYNSSGLAQGSEFLVNTFIPYTQRSPSIAMDSDGDFVIAWMSDGQDGDGLGVYAQRYNSSGLAQGTEFLVNTYTTSGQFAPSIAMDSDGDFVIAWDSFGQDGSYEGIYAQRYNNIGVTQGSEFLVNTYTTSSQLWPSIAMDSDGDFVIAWTSNGQDGDGFGVYAQGYNSSGLAQGSEFLVNTYTTSYQGFPSIAMDSDGDFVIAWWSGGQDGDGFGVYAQRYAATAVSTAFVFTATKEVLLYPNPVQEVLTIENGEGTATVFNALGQPLRQFNITDSKYLLDTNDLPNGIYALQVRKADGTAVAKPFLK
jgi:Secretion system C-terminal sorting domain